ncbi:MAG: YbjQ family protein [Betaproteobacteria bacterium]|jgi:uncharacterized protein YbjQ (UPF0145 family)|nr:heavy metal-binding domain-containing protein [Rhodocyclaceae bacterium]MCA3133868.1 heavy metal-binding domain-containing protein [Rhodocyclaceae bacterium]MCA3143354.1 heavy metal-binding domain-containing protein [Rhodocyclaceae bacterium]MCA3147236.1 heavy metal-binding domain-containing protein [Rhodocyclaceae bacterium]MCE2898434.1 YbjQ family protein [Betaproteobacteria bacterium]
MDHFNLIVFLGLLLLGYVAGRIAESRHYRSIRQREAELGDVLVFASRFPPDFRVRPQTLVGGSVVVGEDYFKSIVAALQKLVGGRLKSYETLLDRARREAVLRMKEEARQKGASMVVNVKFQTFSIPGRNPNSLRAVEVLAYGTALGPAMPRG